MDCDRKADEDANADRDRDVDCDREADEDANADSDRDVDSDRELDSDSGAKRALGRSQRQHGVRHHLAAR